MALIFTALVAAHRLAWRTIHNWWKKRSRRLRHLIVAIIVIVAVGLAAVMKEGKIVFINANNEATIPFQFGYAEKCSMWKFCYVFHNVYCASPKTMLFQRN